ncbi:MAG TPA: S41 family peptidase [Verrucomicrobiae bacterium]|nr:S41 family peptidase [Verrucomicrobiae bacterium]
MARKLRSLLALPVIVLGCSLLGGFWGSRVSVALAAASDPAAQPVEREVGKFIQVYNLVNQNAAQPLDPDKAIYHGAIPGMLETLDPHSNFFDARDYRILMEEERGRYSGVGMQIGPLNDKTVVMVPFPGSPAYRAGVRPGDVIRFVNDHSTEGLTTPEVADLLKGPRNTKVKIGVSREGEKDFVTFNIVREDIDRKTVSDGFWLKPGIAYIKISSFGDNTGRELDDSLKHLGESNIKGLVLDMRGNPGGVLTEAVDVADHFLRKGQTVVSYHGRSSPERILTARNGNRGRNYPVVVVVNRNSASAAEIVSGALQDHDRAWILGEVTFGKGLVQSVINLPEGTGLALTTAHFYTPSGRLIQRNYTGMTLYDYYSHEGAIRDPNDVRMTDSGRTVYGGGGITPDEDYTTPKLDELEGELYRTVLFDFTRSYFATHPASITPGWMPDDATVDRLHSYLTEHHVAFSEAQFKDDQPWIRRYLAREMYLWTLNVDESDKVFAQTDPEIADAVNAMPKAASLVETARKVTQERMRGQ